MKVGFITNHPAPYRDETLLEFSKYPDIELKVYNIQSISENHKEWNFAGKSFNEYLKKPLKLPILGDYNTDIISKIRNMDVLVIGSYYPATNLVALLYAMTHNIPYVVCSDAVEDGHRFRVLKSIIVKRMWNKARAFWVPGNMSKNYFISQGIPEKKIHCGYYVNNASETLNKISENNDELKSKCGIEKEKVFLFVGKLIPTRHVRNLIEATIILENKGYCLKTIIIGGGPEKPLVEESLKKTKSIISIESVPYGELHQYYGIADAYVHPGEEPYSLATVEAVIAGIPVIATEKVGCVCDYLQNENNGYIFDGTPNDLAEKMEKILQEQIDLNEVKKMQDFVLKHRSIKWAAQELLDAVTGEDSK